MENQAPELTEIPVIVEETGTIECPISRLLDIIAAKWSVEILREVSIMPTRTNKFLRVVPGLSTKSLQIRLKELEKYGLIERKEFDVLPRHVEHSITERGLKVLSIYMQIKEVADEMFHTSCECPMQRTEETKLCGEVRCPERPVGRD
ncbi:MAG TPA: helix-turn-helix domain-containing protein [Drouetiella sp.]|jgi:DNA-binding HxlR family transcriptional regulator